MAAALRDEAKAQAEKRKGNEHFAKQRWAEAVGCYSAAHIADPTEPTYPLNRAMAYLKLGKFLDAERDCTKVLSLSPNNIKGLYRRATARLGEGKFDEAKEDFQQVLRLDPKNAEAKSGLEKAQQAMSSRTPLRREPIDLKSTADKSLEEVVRPSGLFHENSIIGSSAPEPTAAQNGSRSSVEAARLFLQQVGMSSGSDAAGSPPPPKASTSTIPAKLPGETGGLLREVITRKTSAKQAQKDEAGSDRERPTSSSAKSIVEPSQTSAVRKTATALSFGASASPNGTPAAIPRPRSRLQDTTAKLTSIDFNRRWKNPSGRLELLSSVDAESIPGMFDAMLEPELIAEILQTLVDGHRASPGDGRIRALITAMLTALANCKRFGMAVAMLDATEKHNAAYLIDVVGRSDLKSIWEVP